MVLIMLSLALDAAGGEGETVSDRSASTCRSLSVRFDTWVGLQVLGGFGHDVQHRSAGDVHLLHSN